MRENILNYDFFRIVTAWNLKMYSKSRFFPKKQSKDLLLFKFNIAGYYAASNLYTVDSQHYLQFNSIRS